MLDRLLRKRRLPLLAFACATTFSLIAHAQDYLAMEPMGARQVQIDGMLREWPGGFDKLKLGSSDSGNSVMIGYDADYLYLAAKIKDAQIVRTRAGGKGEDRLSLSLYVPGYRGKAGRTHSIDIYPGLPGKLAALVKVDGKAVSDAQAVENPNDSGYFLEAKIPKSAISSLRDLSVGLHGVVSYSDASSIGRVKAVSKTGSGQGSAMPPLSTESETGLIEALLVPKGMGLLPAREALGDLTGHGGPERVALYGHFLSIVGPGYKDGKQFYFNELDVENAKQVTHLSLRDFDGDRRDEIVIKKRLGKPEKYREVVQVLKLGADDAPRQVFGQEFAIVTEDGRIENELSISGHGKSAKIVLSQGKVKGFDPANYGEPIIGGAFQSALLPWESVKSRTFAWKGEGIVEVEEQSWQPTMKAPMHGSESAGYASSSSTVDESAPPAPRAPTPDEMLDRVYALYRQDRGVSRSNRPSFDFVTDVVGDGQMERVLVHDRDLVVFGKGFKQGSSYAYLTIGVKDAKDVLFVTARDIVGDGKAEIIVHAVINAQASKSLGGDIVGRQALFIYKVEGDKLTRIFAAETGRSLQKNRVLGGVAFLQNGRGLDIELRPLRALGWTQQSYPFPEDLHPAGGLEPLLLPWTTQPSRHYSFNGSEYQQD